MPSIVNTAVISKLYYIIYYIIYYISKQYDKRLTT